MQFLDSGRYIAVVVSGKVQFYERAAFSIERSGTGRMRK